MATDVKADILDDRRIQLLDFLLKTNKIPEYGEFDLKAIIDNIPAEEYRKLFDENPEFEELWKEVDMAQSLTRFLVNNGLARPNGDKLQLTVFRGRDLQKQGSYNKLLEDERYITNEARRVSELEMETERMYQRQYKINLVIALGTCIAAIYYILEILNGFLGFYRFHH